MRQRLSHVAASVFKQPEDIRSRKFLSFLLELDLEMRCML